jgi:uncharacterized membrane protein
MLYTLNYGFEVSMKWLSALLMSTFGDAFITQPFKVLVIAMIFSFIFKRTVAEQHDIQVETEPSEFKGL